MTREGPRVVYELDSSTSTLEVHIKLVNSVVRDRASGCEDGRVVGLDRIIPLHGVRGVGQYCLHMYDADYLGRMLSKQVDSSDGGLRMWHLNCCD